MIGKAIAFAIVALLSNTARANTPPPIPPDPLALKAARDMVALMQVEKLTSVYLGITDWERRAAEWMARAHHHKSDAFKQIFIGKVRESGRAAAPACVPNAREALAIYYAYRMKASDIEVTTKFMSTDAGQAFVSNQAHPDTSRALSDCVYLAIEGQFPELALQAAQSEALMDKVNRRE